MLERRTVGIARLSENPSNDIGVYKFNLLGNTTFLFKANSKSFILCVTIPDLASKRRTLAGYAEGDHPPGHLRLYFDPPRGLLKNKSFEGKKKLLLHCLNEWEDFLNKWSDSKKLSRYKSVYGLTLRSTARFAIKHLGFQYVRKNSEGEPIPQPGGLIEISNTRQNLMGNLTLLKQKASNL